MLQYSHSVDVQYLEQTHLYQLTVLSTFLVLVQMVTVLLMIKLESEIYLVSSLVQKKDLYATADIGRGSIFFDFTGTAPNRPISLWLLRRRQRSIHIWSNFHSSGRCILQKRVSSGFTDRWYWRIYLQWCCSRRSNNILRSWFWISICNRWNIRNQDICRTCCGTSIFNGTADSASLLRLQKIQQHLHYLRNICLPSTRVPMDLELSLSATTSRLLLESETHSIVLANFFGLGSAAESITIPSANDNSYRYHRCCGDKIPSSIPRLHSIWNIHNIWGIYSSRYRLHSSIHRSWSCNSSERKHYKICWHEICFWYCCTIWICNTQIAQRRSRREQFSSTPKGASAFTALNQVYGYYGDDKDCIWYYNNIWCWYYKTNPGIMVTMETTEIQAHLEHLHSPIHLSYIQKFVIFLRLVLVSPLSDRWICTRILLLRQLRDSRKIQRTCKC